MICSLLAIVLVNGLVEVQVEHRCGQVCRAKMSSCQDRWRSIRRRILF